MERSFQLQRAFTLTKQPALETACQVADINKRAATRNFSPGQMENVAAVSDSDWFGKGHSFATFYDPVERRFQLGTTELSLSDLLAMYAFGMVMGKVSTSLVSAGVYDHVFTFKEPASDEDGVDCISSSIIEKIGGAGQYLYSGVVTSQATLTGGGTDHLRLAFQQTARKRATDATALPSMSSLSFLKFLRATFMFGASTDSPETMVSDEVIGFDMTVNQNPTWWALPGVSEADQMFYSRATVGKQSISGKLSTFIDAARVALFENNTECKLRITMEGSTITGLFKRAVTIDIPHFHVTALPVANEKDMVKIDITFGDEGVLKVGSAEPITVTVRSNLDGTEILVESN